MENIRSRRWAAFASRALPALAVALAACQGVKNHYGSHDTETDTQTDMDASVDGGTDGGGDTDTDTDTETETIDTDFPSTTIPTTCAEAVENPTSVGCDFFAADLDSSHQYNVDLEPYVIVVSNPQESENAHIALSDGTDGEIYSTVLSPGSLEVIDVACASGCLVPPHEIETQGLARGAAFRLESDVPVVAYQWNPHNGDEASTDASLLLPSTSLGKVYITAAWGQGTGADMPTSRMMSVTCVLW